MKPFDDEYMAEIKKLCSLEIAKQLKEMGYNEPCRGYYRKILLVEEYSQFIMETPSTNEKLNSGIHVYYSAPTWMEAAEWAFKNMKPKE